VTRPTAAMREAMFAAPVGDDVFGEDPTVNALQAKAAALFGKEAGLFLPSGTMANQVGLAVRLGPGQEVVCDHTAHIYRYEGGGIMSNAGASVKLLHGDRGRLTAAQIERELNPPHDIHQPTSTVVALENTSNKGGGACYALSDIAAIRQLCTAKGLWLHLDGARVFNALVAKGESPEQHGALFDSLSVCLSKGLGAPVGSVLLGSRAFIDKARRVRKRLGGGMRQAGFLAAAGIYALDHHVERLAEDHRRARRLGELLAGLPYVKEVLPVETNIVIFELAAEFKAERFVAEMAGRGLRCILFGHQQVRLVTHLDLDDAMMDRAEELLKAWS